MVSGPSGSGKTTLCERLAAEGQAYYAISCTTRPPRPGEVDGEDYFFHTAEEFRAKIHAGEFIEYAEVHGNFYGTLKSEILNNLQSGKDVVMDIDVQGADLVRSCDETLLKKGLVDLFVTPPNEEELRKRLTLRKTDSDEVIERRMKNSLEEMQQCDKYTYLLVSGGREADYSKIHALLEAERLRQSRLNS